MTSELHNILSHVSFWGFDDWYAGAPLTWQNPCQLDPPLSMWCSPNPRPMSTGSGAVSLRCFATLPLKLVADIIKLIDQICGGRTQLGQAARRRDDPGEKESCFQVPRFQPSLIGLLFPKSLMNSSPRGAKTAWKLTDLVTQASFWPLSTKSDPGP